MFKTFFSSSSSSFAELLLFELKLCYQCLQFVYTLNRKRITTRKKKEEKKNMNKPGIAIFFFSFIIRL